MNPLFKRVAGARPGRTLFNLSHEKKFTCDMGELIPILVEFCVPGDIFKIGVSALIKTTPIIAPIMHQIDITFHYYFHACRNLWSEWEDFVTGGDDGTTEPTIPKFENVGLAGKGSISDYLGYPIGVDLPTEDAPVFMIHRCYNDIWNQYYRDESIQDESSFQNDVIHNVSWEKDYFGAALLSQQRGVAPAIPISGTTSAVFDKSTGSFGTGLSGVAQHIAGRDDSTITHPHAGTLLSSAPYVTALNNFITALNDNTVDLEDATPIDISTFREAFQVQRFLERSNRAGTRYIEHIRGHFGEAPTDERLDRPEYIGGCKCPLIVSEVLQTSQSDTTPQGTMTGHGIGINQSYIGSYRVKEHGFIMGFMFVRPKPEYQQGINRLFTFNTKYDLYWPEFAHLSEQPIYRKELYATDVHADNNIVFGFTGAYDEYRVRNNIICGNFRDTYDYWHLSRQFSSAPALNDDFLKCVPRKDVFAVQNEDCLLCQVGNIVTALRPMPAIAEPGYIDHG